MRWSLSHSFPRCFPPLVVLLASVALGSLGCKVGTSDPLEKKAKSTCLDVMEQDPKFAQYGLAVAARSRAPFARQLLLDSILSDDYQTALEAAKGISDDPNPQAAQALRQVFSTKQGALRLTAASALAKLGDREALEWLKGQLDRVSGPAQLKMIVLLAEQGEKDLALPVIRQKMESDVQEIRDEAYAALGEIRQPWATELLLKGLGKEHGASRKQAIISLGRTGDASVASTLTRFVNTKGLVFATLEALGALGNAEAKSALERMLREEQPLVRIYAGAALWKLDLLEEPQALLGPLVSHGDPRTRLNLAEQLASVENELALSMLLTLAEDEDPAVREAAVRGIGRRRNVDALSALLQLVHDPAYTVSILALEAVGRVAQSEVVEQLEPLLHNDNPYVVISAAHAILEIKARGDSAAQG